EAPGGLAMPAAIEELAAALRRPSACLLAFPAWRANAGRPLLRAVGLLAANGARVAAVIVDAASLRPSVPALGQPEVGALSRELASAGVDVYLVRPEEDPAACLPRSPSAAG